MPTMTTSSSAATDEAAETTPSRTEGVGVADRRSLPAFELSPLELRQAQEIIDASSDRLALLLAAQRLEALAAERDAVPFASVEVPFGAVLGFRFDKDYMIASAHLRIVAQTIRRMLDPSSRPEKSPAM